MPHTMSLEISYYHISLFVYLAKIVHTLGYMLDGIIAWCYSFLFLLHYLFTEQWSLASNKYLNVLGG